ncbi:MAG: hypothetical protein GQ569_04335 [Methylococcaceae bacterium]|nr:hypothetical protein [Methylococcaceae bacterium]
MMSFTEDLTITLSLKIAGTIYKIPASDVKSLELDLHTYGFNGEISFIIACEESVDTLLPAIRQDDLIEILLQVETARIPPKAISIPLNLSGLVTLRSFSEQTLTNVLPTQTLMLNRHYHLEFADPAQVLWKQHHPCDLFTDSTLQTLIAAHCGEKIDLTYDWEILQVEHPVLSLSLGAPTNHASFYDYIIWLVDTHNGVFSYDLTTNQYSLTATKNSSSETRSLDPFEVAKLKTEFPEVLRYQANVLNAYVDTPKTTNVDNEQLIAPIRRDHIDRYPIASNMQARGTLETARFKQRLHEVSVEYQKFQLKVTPPNQSVDFLGSPAWNASLFNQDKSYCVREWHLSAYWQKQGDIPNHSIYEIEHSLKLESSEELWVDLPIYTQPVYPVFVEGKLVCEQGEETETPYQFYTDTNTSIDYYLVSIPLWENKQVRTSFQPNMDTGQFYFPRYKKAKVLVGLNFDNAFIDRFLDWENGAALPQDSQGNQLVMGKSTTSKNIIKHTYVDSKPDLQIERTEEKDTELLQFSDGYIILRTQLEE